MPSLTSTLRKNKSAQRSLPLVATLFLYLNATAQTSAPPAGAVPAAVVQVVPIVVYDRLPQETCTDLPQQRQHCRTTYVRQERVQGYEVTYTHQGRLHTTELAYDPGATVLILPPHGQRSYSSQAADPGDGVQPGRKRYGSAPAGADTHSIEYRSTQPDIPIVLDLHAPIQVPGLPQPNATPPAGRQPPSQHPSPAHDHPYRPPSSHAAPRLPER